MSNTTTTTTTTEESWGVNRKTAAMVFGVAFLLIGLLGPVAGGGARGELIVFGRNYLHDLVHLGSGLLGVGAALYDHGAYAREYLLGFGAVYLVVLVAGFVVPDLMNDLIALDMADNVLHLVLTAGLLGAGFALDD